jgi:FMN phosphatase YigB (HAD superfamily)
VEGEKIADFDTATNSTPTPVRRGGRGGGPGVRRALDVAALIRREGDFDAQAVREAEEVALLAGALYRMACAEGVHADIALAIKNWNDAAKASATVRERFLEIQEKTRALLSLDIVMDIVGTELQAVRSLLLRLGERIAAKANPADPASARKAVDAGVDDIFHAITVAAERIEKEIAAPLVSA